MNPAGNSPLETLLTLAESSKLLNISLRQIYRLIAEGKIPVVMVGKRSPRLRPGDLRQYLDACTINHRI